MHKPDYTGTPGCFPLPGTSVCLPILLCMLITLLTISPVSAGEFTFLHDHPGKLSAPVTVSNVPQKLLSKPDAAAYKKNLEHLRDLLAKQPVFNPPRGVEIIGYFRPIDEFPKTKKAPFPGFGYLRFHFYHQQKKTGKPVRICCTTDEIYISINNPDTGLDVYGAAGFETRVFYEPQRAGDLHGFPVYRMDNGDEVMILSRNGKIPWKPVTREEYVNAELKSWQKAAAESPLDTISPEIARTYREALSAMSPEERKMQARYLPATPFEPTLAPVGSDEGRPLVRTDPAWFDPSLPKSAFQLITLRFSYTNNLDQKNPGPTEYGDIAPYRVWEALHTSNWAEISNALSR